MKLCMFRTVPLSIIRSFSLYTQQWYMSYRFVDSFRAGSGWNESCLQTCMTYTIAVCTVNNSWWWTEELPKTCRVSFQNKIEKLVHLVGFIIRSFYATCRWGAKLLTDLNLLPRWRMHVNVPPLLHMPSLRNTELSTMQTLRLSFFILRIILCGQKGES
jgi:hypothetical protein